MTGAMHFIDLCGFSLDSQAGVIIILCLDMDFESLGYVEKEKKDTGQ